MKYAVVYESNTSNFRQVHTTHLWRWRARMEAWVMNSIGKQQERQNADAARALGIQVRPRRATYAVREVDS